MAASEMHHDTSPGRPVCAYELHCMHVTAFRGFWLLSAWRSAVRKVSGVLTRHIKESKAFGRPGRRLFAMRKQRF